MQIYFTSLTIREIQILKTVLLADPLDKNQIYRDQYWQGWREPDTFHTLKGS